jgi:hypothetical protein
MQFGSRFSGCRKRRGDQRARFGTARGTLVKGSDIHMISNPFSFLSKLWRGQYSLATSFWGFSVIGSFVVTSVNVVATLLWPVLRPVLVLGDLGYQIITVVGVWRSADTFVAARGGRRSLTPADLAKVTAAKIVVGLQACLLAVSSFRPDMDP